VAGGRFLRDVEGLTGEEAAAALGIGLAAMKSRLHRARLELKERVEAKLRRAEVNVA
jgi:RNA polymerase sigma-70 factor (ECF subfamily)